MRISLRSGNRRIHAAAGNRQHGGAGGRSRRPGERRGGEPAWRQRPPCPFSRKPKPENAPADVIRRIYGRHRPGFSKRLTAGRMATTMITTIFRQDKATVAHVGDSRGVPDSGGENQTANHGPFLHGSPGQTGAAARAQRDDQPASLDADPQHRLRANVPLRHHDRAAVARETWCCNARTASTVSCWTTKSWRRSSNIIPGEACKRLIALAEKRQASDNVSVQIIQVWEVDQARSRAR